MTKQTMGDLIAGLRKEKGLTQKDLAEKMNVTDKAVSKWERNLSCPDVNTIPHLAQVLGVSVEELMTSSPKREEPQVDEKAREREELIDLILRVLPFSLGISVTVLGLLKEVDQGNILTGLGLLCVAVYQIRQSKK